MTHAERNAVISKKITAYTEKFTASKTLAKQALEREGFSSKPKNEKKQSVVA